MQNDLAHLRTAGLPTDGPGLQAFFAQRILNDAQREHLQRAIEQLAADSFDVRQSASAELVAAGLAARPLLRQAREANDVEVVRRAERALEQIAKEESIDRLLAAARHFLRTAPDQAWPTLIDYLNVYHNDQAVFEGTLQAMHDTLARSKQVPTDLLEQITSTKPTHRLIAVRLLSALPGQIERVRGLVSDPDHEVRFLVAEQLLRRGEQAGMPVLLNFLDQGPIEYAFGAEDLLCRLLEQGYPERTLGAGTSKDRAACRAAWDRWWQVNQPNVDLTRLNSAPALRGLTLIAEVDGGPTARIWECDRQGSQTWEMTQLGGPVDVQRLPNGNILIAEYYTSIVTERNRKGEIIWQSDKLGTNPVSCQRLANGHTLIATMREVTELNVEGKPVGPKYPVNGSIFQARRDRYGHTFILSDGKLQEFDHTGKQVRTLPVNRLSGWGGFALLPNGHILIAKYTSENSVVEYDAHGKEVWQLQASSPTRVQRLRNGNTLVAGGNQQEVVEYNREGEIIFKVTTKGRPFAAIRY